MTTPSDEVEVNVVGVFEQRFDLRDQEQRVPLLVLKDPSERELRLRIGSCEGLAIHIAIQQQMMPRPLTHDLAVSLLERLSANLDRVVIDDLSNHASHATIHLHTTQGDLTLDARPGDAVALALRAEVPICATEGVLARAAHTDGDTL
ncbi:MAG: bifunctional nuclease family protein [Armatimonadota bacterium]|nr:MAG: bifunctional nuclease family protein [Armatimonadota bacterium]